VAYLWVSCARCQAKFLTSRYVRMYRVIIYISNTLIKLMINLHNTHHKVIAKLYSFTLRRKTTDKHDRSEISLDTGDSQFERPVPSSPYTQQPARGSIDAKNELGVKGRRKLTWVLHIVVCRLILNFIGLWCLRIDDRTFESWKSLTIMESRI